MWSPESSEALLLSVRVSAVATVVIFFAVTPLALWLTRRPSGLSYTVELMLSLPLVVPPVVTGYFLLLALGPSTWFGRLLDSAGIRFPLDWKGAVVASGVLSLPLFLAVARAAFQKCDKGLEEAARTLSAGPVKAFFTITFPVALPGLLAAAALTFARAFGEFGATMMLAGNIPGKTRTVPQAIYTNIQAGRGQAALALAVVSVAVGAGAFIAARAFGERQGASRRNRLNA